MPLSSFDPVNAEPVWALWQIEEPIQELEKQMNPTRLELSEFDQIHHPRKKLEWLASRLVIKHLVESMGSAFQGIYKDAFGKPHLVGLPYSISIAHCFPFAVGAIAKDHPLGIDIEMPQDKLLHIRDKFLNDREAKMAGTNLETLCKFWTAKEVLYKIYGRKKLIFKEHMEVSEISTAPGLLRGDIRYQNFCRGYNIISRQLHGHFISYSA